MIGCFVLGVNTCSSVERFSTAFAGGKRLVLIQSSLVPDLDVDRRFKETFDALQLESETIWCVLCNCGHVVVRDRMWRGQCQAG